jgi:hypothetical protein
VNPLSGCFGCAWSLALAVLIFGAVVLALVMATTRV